MYQKTDLECIMEGNIPSEKNSASMQHVITLPHSSCTCLVSNVIFYIKMATSQATEVENIFHKTLQLLFDFKLKFNFSSRKLASA